LKKRLIIVDISNFIFRAFYAVRPLHAPDGTPVNAVHGVLSMLLKIFSDYRPTHFFIARDTGEKTFRSQLYPEYKAHRPPLPEEIVPQFAVVETLMEKMGITGLSVKNYEADDVIGSCVVQWRDQFDEIYIATSDKDLMQFVDSKVKILDTMKDILVGPDEVEEKMGVSPSQIVDYLTMLGDSSDNIPGVAGVGAKGAAKLLAEYKNLEGIFKHKDKIANKRTREAIINGAADAEISKKLITIVTDLHLPATTDSLAYRFSPSRELIEYLKGLGFKSVITRLEDMVRETERVENEDVSQEIEQFQHSSEEASLGQSPFKTRVAEETEIPKLIDDLKTATAVGIFTLFDGVEPYFQTLVGIAITLDGKEAIYLPTMNFSGDMVDKLLHALRENPKLELRGSDIKNDVVHQRTLKKEFTSKVFDVLLARHLLDSEKPARLEALAIQYYNFFLKAFQKQTPVPTWDIDYAASYAGDRACLCFTLASVMRDEMSKHGLERIFDQLDIPLVSILARMEVNGVLLNVPYLAELEKIFNERIADIEKRIEAVAGETVNLRSPKQVSVLLFEKLGFPTVRKTKTGQSTDADVLQVLEGMGTSEVPTLLLKYRELEKLLSTYVRVLPTLLNSKTRRLHTHFNQSVTSTGRLSADNPNLQNIPVRSDNGKLIRKAFIAGPGKILLSADYSQVELRLLAGLAKDPVMTKAFMENVDIHTQTASEVMGIPLESVTSKDRSVAKAVNFGLMYGQSSYGLSQALGIGREEARHYIENYFAKFGRIKIFLDELKEKCEKDGHAETLMGRKRFLPNIHSQNRNIKGEAERMAVNSPIQGTAADIIKMAMIKIDAEITRCGLKSEMLLQVHDELIFEVPEQELGQMKKIVRDGMESAIDFPIPLSVQMGIGVNWLDIKEH
jgi:DNA polymerase-1